jgi:hypothetical protein
MHDLLDHWRRRSEGGLVPLIWNPSCRLLVDAKKRPARTRSRRDPDSDDDSGEEDFASQLGHISENCSESDRNQPSSQGVHGVIESDNREEVNTELVAPPAVPHYTCKSEPPIYECHITYLLYVASDGERSTEAPTLMNTYTEDGMRISYTLQVSFINVQHGLGTGGPSGRSKERRKQAALLRSRHEIPGDSSSEDHPTEREPLQPQGRGKRQVRMTEKAK